MKQKTGISFDPLGYDFLDALDKDGWHWEFTRRNDGYRKAYEEMANLRKICKVRNCFDCEVLSNNPCPLSQAYYIEDKFQINPFFKPPSGSKMPPDPRIKYSDLPDRVKPVTLVRPIKPIKTFTETGLQAVIRQTWDVSQNVFEQIWRYNDPKYAMFKFVNDILSPNPDEHEATIFIGISQNATKEELRRAFNNLLKKYVRTKTSIGDAKRQPKKWKSGLMIWDIRLNYRLPFKEAGKVVGISEDTAKKQYYKTYEHIYRKKYDPVAFERPEIKKAYLEKQCDSCSKKPTCTDLCPDVISFVNQDVKSYQRDRTPGNIEKLDDHVNYKAWLEE